MSLSAQGYFECLQSHLNMDYYGLPMGIQEIELKEKVYTQDGDKTYQTTLKFNGDLFGIKLDKEKTRGNALPLFHFLDNTAKPWAKRCDFVLFNLVGRRIHVYCFEFKSKAINPEVVVGQLEASECWLKSLSQIVRNYTNKSFTLYLTKYVLSDSDDPSKYLDNSNRFLQRDHTVRHYKYSEVNGLSLQDLENPSVIQIRG